MAKRKRHSKLRPSSAPLIGSKRTPVTQKASFLLWWYLAVLGVLSAPLRLLGRRTIGVIFLTISVWLGIGVLFSLTQYGLNTIERYQVGVERAPLLEQQKVWEQIYITHPTSREVLKSLSILSHELGETEKLKFYTNELEKIDPTSSLPEQVR